MNGTERPRVSILIPTFNQSHLLKEAIDSALGQTYENIEIVVSDDASTDNTSEVVASYKEPRIVYFRNESNLGRVKNYHRTLYEYATGDWAVNLDGDDYFIYPQFIEECVAALEFHPEAILAFADQYQLERGKEIDNSNISARSGRVQVYDGDAFLFSMPRNPVRLQHLSTLYNRSAALNLDFYRADIISSDYESLFRLIIGRQIIHIDRIVGVWRKHGSNFSSRKDATQWVNNLDLYPSVASFARETMAHGNVLCVQAWLIRNFVHYARRIIVRAIMSRDPILFHSVLSGIWEKDRILCILTIISPITLFSIVKKVLRSCFVRN